MVWATATVWDMVATMAMALVWATAWATEDGVSTGRFT